MHERAVAGRGFERNGIGGANAILGTTKQARASGKSIHTSGVDLTLLLPFDSTGSLNSGELTFAERRRDFV